MRPKLFWAALPLLGVLTMSATADDKPAADSPQKAMTYEKDGAAVLKYWLYLPPDYKKEKKAFPLLVFLHGAGETGSDLNLVKKHGPPKILDTKKNMPFIVVSPQAPTRGWKTDAVLGLIDEVCAKNRVDKDRIYLTGLSMGGFGTWTTAAAAPDRFAAIVPICGGGKPEDAEKIKKIPAWVFHGAKDTAVPLARSEAMVQALKKAGAEPKFTVYPDVGHDSWTASYDNPELYTWLLEQKRTDKGAK